MKLKVYRIDRFFIGRIGHFFKKPDLPVAPIPVFDLFGKVG